MALAPLARGVVRPREEDSDDELPQHERQRLRVELDEAYARNTMPYYGRSRRYGRYKRRYKRKRGGGRSFNIAKLRWLVNPNNDGKRPWFNRRTRQWEARMSDTTRDDYGETWAAADRAQKMARLRDGYRGLGDYRDYLKYVPRAIGGAYGAYTGGLPGAARGWNLGAGVSKFIGWGDYQDASSSAYGPTVDNQLLPGGNAPISVNADPTNKTGDLFFTHTEFITNIYNTSTGFENRAFPLNPGMKETFPFLSQLAKNFTMYEFHGLIFEYRPTSGEFGSASNALGKIIMATDYDPDSPPFVTSQNMENYDYATSCKPSVGMRHGVETAPNQSATKMQYIRTIDGTRDKIFTDIGLFQIATDGLPTAGAGAIGELWVTYCVKLSRSQILPLEDNMVGCFRMAGLVHTTSPFSNYPIFETDTRIIMENHVGGSGVVLKEPDSMEFPESTTGGTYLIMFTANSTSNDHTMQYSMTSTHRIEHIHTFVNNSGTAYGSSFHAPVTGDTTTHHVNAFMVKILPQTSGNLPPSIKWALTLTGGTTDIYGTCIITRCSCEQENNVPLV